MTPLLLFLLLTNPSAGRLELVNDTFEVAKREMRSVDVSLEQQAAVIEVSYRLKSDDEGEGVSVSLIGPGQPNSPANGRMTYLRLIPGQREGSFRFPATAKGQYRVGLDGRGLEESVEVELVVTLDFEEEGLLRPGLLDRGRRYTVIALSLLFFFGVAFWSGGKLILAIRRRPPASPPRLF